MDKKHLYIEPEEIDTVDIVWDEYGYKRISVELKNGETYVVESD